MTAKMVWEYVNHGLNIVPDYGTGNWPAEADGCIKCEIIPRFKVELSLLRFARYWYFGTLKSSNRKGRGRLRKER